MLIESNAIDSPYKCTKGKYCTKALFRRRDNLSTYRASSNTLLGRVALLSKSMYHCRQCSMARYLSPRRKEPLMYRAYKEML